MHLIALAFSHLDDAVSRDLPQLLLRGSAGEILDRVIGSRPIGLKRALDRLPHRVLNAASYRLLLELLHDPASAKALAHADFIEDASLKGIASVPPSLRPVVLTMTELNWLGGFSDSLQFFVDRGAAPMVEALLAELQTLRQPAQLIARLKRMIDALPLPDVMPPAQVAAAQRLDSPAEIRSLARRWRNCLEGFVFDLNQGDCAIYLWNDGTAPAACLVWRRGRLGWFFDETRGPLNKAIEFPRLNEITRTFAEAGMPPLAIANCIRGIVEAANRGERPHHPPTRLRASETWDDDAAFDLDASAGNP